MTKIKPSRLILVDQRDFAWAAMAMLGKHPSLNDSELAREVAMLYRVRQKTVRPFIPAARMLVGFDLPARDRSVKLVAPAVPGLPPRRAKRKRRQR